MKTDAMSRLREAVCNLGTSGKIVSNAMMYQALGADDQAERDRIRRRCNQMVQTGELIRVKPGHYTYNSKAAPARNEQKLSAVYRALRSSKPGFTCMDIARTSGASYTHVIKYLKFLEDKGFVRRHGKAGNSITYKGTNLLRETRHTPLPPRPLGDPFEEERKLVHELVGLFLLKDPYQPAVARQISANCTAILNRFATQNEKGD